MQSARLFTGIDIIEIERIKEAISRWGPKFLERIYTSRELELYSDKVERLAARFAGKEAVMKALSALETSISWREVEILSGSGGRPLVNLYGQAKKQMEELGLSSIEISLSHSRDNAVALVIGLRER
jgi:holo-[acyl-carrier protein] synthase